jgi:hypothetical protein
MALDHKTGMCTAFQAPDRSTTYPEDRRDGLFGLEEEVFQIQQSDLAILFEAHKRRCHPRAPPAACTPNSVDIILNLLGHVEIDHVLHTCTACTLLFDQLPAN